MPIPSLRRSCGESTRSRSICRPSGILLVTDDLPLAEACVRVIESEGHAVHHVRHSGHALLACLAGERVDLMIGELSMDEGSGPALTARLRRYVPGMKALYFAKSGTACDTPDVLIRPFTRDELLWRVQALLSAVAPTFPGQAS